MADTDPWWWTQYFDAYQSSVAKEQAGWDADPGAPHDAGPYTSKAQANELGPAQYKINVATAKTVVVPTGTAWYYNSVQKTTLQATAAQVAQINAALGFHAVIGPYTTEALAKSEGPQGTYPNPNSNPATDAVVNATGSALESVVGGLVGVLENKTLWLRVGEVVLGLILVGVGLARITHTGNAISKAVKVAAL